MLFSDFSTSYVSRFGDEAPPQVWMADDGYLSIDRIATGVYALGLEGSVDILFTDGPNGACLMPYEGPDDLSQGHHADIDGDGLSEFITRSYLGRGTVSVNE